MTDYDFKNLKSVLPEVSRYAIPIKEPTLFGVGGRGYYENPASDLLVFFLKPHAEHNLGHLFLSTFLECIEEDPRTLNMSKVDIQREVPTTKGNKIDIQILGSDWCLLIENKIFHWEANPFPDYVAHVKTKRKAKMLFSILSPGGLSNQKGWKGIAYKSYCEALLNKVPELENYRPLSKWQLFAREFILHMKNELYTPPLTDEQADFLEKHAAAFNDARKLLDLYPDYLCGLIKKELSRRLAYEVEVVANWAILISSSERWGKAYIAFRPPTMDESDFQITIYPEEGELRRGQATNGQLKLLQGMEHTKDYWYTSEGFTDRNKAINDFIPRIKLIERSPHS